MIKAVLVLTGLIGILLIAATLPAQEQQRSRECVSADDRERLRKLTYDAIDVAFNDQVEHLFGVWMRDEVGQPGRAQKGMSAALHGYIGSRKLAAEWNPPQC